MATINIIPPEQKLLVISQSSQDNDIPIITTNLNISDNYTNKVYINYIEKGIPGSPGPAGPPGANGSGGTFDLSVLSLGNLSGSNAIDCDLSKQTQTLSLNGTSVAFTKGTGWPSLNSIERNIILDISVSATTSVTWSIIDRWYRQPDSPLPIGNHIVLLRAVGNLIQGHYIGYST
jgi:hypothetical protein